MKAIFKFKWDCGRSGYLTGLFVESREIVAATVGKGVYFGEVLGKHSEVYGTIAEGEIIEVTPDSEMVELFEEHQLSTGFNPCEHLQVCLKCNCETDPYDGYYYCEDCVKGDANDA